MQDSMMRTVILICVAAVIFGLRAIYRRIRTGITGNDPESFNPDSDVHRSPGAERVGFCWFCGRPETKVSYVQMQRATFDWGTRTVKLSQVPLCCCNDCHENYHVKRIVGNVVGTVIIIGTVFTVLWFSLPYTTTPTEDAWSRCQAAALLSLLAGGLISILVLPRWPFPFRKKLWRHPVVAQFHRNGYLDSKLLREPLDRESFERAV